MSYAKYQDQSIPLTDTFVAIQFGFKADSWILLNDDSTGTNEVAWSYDGTNIHGTLKPTEAISLDTADVHQIFLKYINSAPAYRLIVNGSF